MSTILVLLVLLLVLAVAVAVVLNRNTRAELRRSSRRASAQSARTQAAEASVAAVARTQNVAVANLRASIDTLAARRPPTCGPWPAAEALTVGGLVRLERDITTNAAVVRQLRPTPTTVWSAASRGPVDGTGATLIGGMATDCAGNVWITGSLGDSTGAPIVFGDISVPAPTVPSVFVAKLDAAGKWLSVMLPVSATGQSEGGGIRTDCAGDVYVTGAFTATLQITPDTPLLTTDVGSWSSFTLRMGVASGVSWAVQDTHQSGNCSVSGRRVAVDCMGRVFVVGLIDGNGSSSFAGASGDFTIGVTNQFLAFAVGFDSTGVALWAVQDVVVAGNASNYATGLDVDCQNQLIVVGFVDSSGGSDSIRVLGGRPQFALATNGAGFKAVGWAALMNATTGVVVQTRRCTQGAGSTSTLPLDVAVDARGGAYIVGGYRGDSTTSVFATVDALGDTLTAPDSLGLFWGFSPSSRWPPTSRSTSRPLCRSRPMTCLASSCSTA